VTRTQVSESAQPLWEDPNAESAHSSEYDASTEGSWSGGRGVGKFESQRSWSAGSNDAMMNATEHRLPPAQTSQFVEEEDDDYTGTALTYAGKAAIIMGSAMAGGAVGQAVGSGLTSAISSTSASGFVTSGVGTAGKIAGKRLYKTGEDHLFRIDEDENSSVDLSFSESDPEVEEKDFLLRKLDVDDYDEAAKKVAKEGVILGTGAAVGGAVGAVVGGAAGFGVGAIPGFFIGQAVGGLAGHVTSAGVREGIDQATKEEEIPLDEFGIPDRGLDAMGKPKDGIELQENRSVAI